MSKTNRKKKILWLLLPLLLLVLVSLDMRFTVRTYTVDLPRMEGNICLAVIADLHSCRYGKDQKNLLNVLDAQHVDAVLLCGDFFDDKLPLENARLTLEGIAGKYPCYYVTGNHEYWADAQKFLQMMELLDTYGVENISGRTLHLTLNGCTVNLCGADDPDNPWNRSLSSQLPALSSAADPALDTLLVSHRPEAFDAYCAHGFDLVLSGHAHGGQWRIPGILNGLLAPDQGFIPQYAGGLYHKDNTTMIVSRGLARESTLIPRIFNRPELVIVHLQ